MSLTIAQYTLKAPTPQAFIPVIEPLQKYTQSTDGVVGTTNGLTYKLDFTSIPALRGWMQMLKGMELPEWEVSCKAVDHLFIDEAITTKGGYDDLDGSAKVQLTLSPRDDGGAIEGIEVSGERAPYLGVFLWHQLANCVAGYAEAAPLSAMITIDSVTLSETATHIHLVEAAKKALHEAVLKCKPVLHYHTIDFMFTVDLDKADAIKEELDARVIFNGVDIEGELIRTLETVICVDELLDPSPTIQAILDKGAYSLRQNDWIPTGQMELS